MKKFKSFLALLLVLCAVFSLSACTSTPATPTEPESTIPASGSTLGEGAHSFTFEVKMKDETTYTYTIQTDEETVGAALLGLKLIDGEDGQYGLYVKSVLGEKLDYDTDGYWWGLYVDGESSMVGVDSVAITDGSTYTFTAEKA